MQGQLIYLHGSKTATKTLTGSYVSSTPSVDVSGYEMLTLFISYTPGVNSNPISLAPEWSIDGGSTWFSDTLNIPGTASGGAVSTVVAAQTYDFIGAATTTTYGLRMRFPVLENGFMNSYGSGILFRVKVKETSGGAYGSCKVAASLQGHVTRG